MERKTTKNPEEKGKSYKKPNVEVTVYDEEVVAKDGNRYRIAVFDDNTDEIVQEIEDVAGFIIAASLTPDAPEGKFALLCNHDDEDAAVGAIEFLMRALPNWLSSHKGVADKVAVRLDSYFRETRDKILRTIFGNPS